MTDLGLSVLIRHSHTSHSRVSAWLSTDRKWSATCNSDGMILLVWSSEKAQQCAVAIEQAFHSPVRVVGNLDAASEELRNFAFVAVLLDQHLWDCYPSKAELLLRHVGDAVPIIVNFAISATERVVRSLESGLEHWTRTTQRARRHASAILVSEFKDELTALFLSCGLALQEPTLSPCATDQLRKIEGIAKQIRQKLVESESLTVAAHA